MTPLPAPPADPRGLEAFPRVVLPAGARLLRIHRQRHGPLWFRHDGEGRFDLPPPRGTLYAAADPLGAYVEVFRHIRFVPEEEVAARRLSTLATRRDMSLADGTARRTLAFGLTGALHTTPAYIETQAWAAALAAAGFDGLRYLVRHDPAQRLVGFALFGAAGAAAAGGDWEVASTRPISDALIRQVQDRFGLSILPTDVL